VPLPPPVAPPPPCGHPAEGRTPRDLSVDPETRGIADAIVSLVDPPRDVPPPASRRAVLDQASCEFSPRAQVVPVGSELLVRNSDPELHNIHARIAADRRELFNVGMAPGNPDLPILLRRPGLVEVRCDVHPWMGAAILVADHPFAAATDARGAFGFPAPPSGIYRVHAWHAKLGAVEKEIEIGISNEAAVEIEMPGPAPAKGG
jgi:plastocyanin